MAGAENAVLCLCLLILFFLVLLPLVVYFAAMILEGCEKRFQNRWYDRGPHV